MSTEKPTGPYSAHQIPITAPCAARDQSVLIHVSRVTLGSLLNPASLNYKMQSKLARGKKIMKKKTFEMEKVTIYKLYTMYIVIHNNIYIFV